MSGILDLLKNLEKIDVGTAAEIAMMNTAEAATAAQKAQLAQGLTSEEEPITRLSTGSDEYSPSYAKVKGRRKPIDLKRFGDFYAGILLDVRGDTFVLASADSKAGKLMDDYGEDIFGFGYEARVRYILSLRPELIRILIAQMQGRFG